MQKTICVFSSSSDALAEPFYRGARELGALIAQRGYALVYGGSNRGLMVTVARAVHEHGGTVIGVLPAALQQLGIACDFADELIVTRDLRERKGVMESRSDAFVALPGGFGTLEELLEILTLKQLKLHEKPLVLLDTEGFYRPLLHLFEHVYREGFAKPDCRELYYLAEQPEAVLNYLDSYEPPQVSSKFF